MTRVVVIPGDGIGPEVIASAIEDIPQGFELTTLDLGAERFLRTGEVLTEGDLEVVRASDAVLLGAVGDPRVPDGILERGILLRLRRELDLYVNLRPFPELGLVFVRENSEGLYAGKGRREAGVAEEVSVNTLDAVERCSRFAFELAESRSGVVTWVHKTNVLSYAGGLWREAVETTSERYPDVDVRYEHVDAAAYHLVRDPTRFDVILTDNLFGDILSDLAAGIGRGLGAAASANLHPDPTTRPTSCLGLFEPVHGSAPDIAGTGSADPTAARAAVALLNHSLMSVVGA